MRQLQRVVLALIAILGFACAASVPPRSDVQPGAASKLIGATVDHRKELIRRLYLDGYLRGDTSVIDSVYATTYLRHDAGETAPASREDQYALAKALRQSFPDLQLTVDFVMADGDFVAARWTMWGTETGAGFFGPPSGKSFRFSGINVYRFENGQVVELWNHRDDLHWFRQLGLLPPPGRMRE